MLFEKYIKIKKNPYIVKSGEETRTQATLLLRLMSYLLYHMTWKKNQTETQI